jgi:hypothetical protein
LIFQKIKTKGEKQMNISKISIGLLFLILALVVVPGASAHPNYDMVCTDCHTTPSGSITATTPKTTVAPGESFIVTLTWTSTMTAKWPSVANDNALFGIASGGVIVSGSGTGTTTLTAPSVPGTYSVAVYAATSSQRSTSATIQIIVQTPAVNNAPVANSQTVTTSEGTAKAVTLTASDADGNTLTYTVVSNPTHGALSGTAPALTYTPNAGFNGSDSFTFKVNDGIVDSNTATVSITVTAATPVHTAPVANNQAVTTPEGTAKAVTLTVTGGATLTYTVGTPSHGTLTGTAPALTYTPNAGFNGSDSFTFKVNDGIVDSNTATVSITITAATTIPASVLTKINVTPATANLKVGDKKSFIANAFDQLGALLNNVIVSWTSSNPTVGTIDSNGNFTALSNGTTTITASNSSITGSASVIVSANKSKNHDKDEDVSEDESAEVDEHDGNELDDGSDDEVNEHHGKNEDISEDESDEKVNEHNSNVQDEHKDKVTEPVKQHEDTNKVTENKHTESGSNNPVSVSNKKRD